MRRRRKREGGREREREKRERRKEKEKGAEDEGKAVETLSPGLSSSHWLVMQHRDQTASFKVAQAKEANGSRPRGSEKGTTRAQDGNCIIATLLSPFSRSLALPLLSPSPDTRCSTAEAKALVAARPKRRSAGRSTTSSTALSCRRYTSFTSSFLCPSLLFSVPPEAAAHTNRRHFSDFASLCPLSLQADQIRVEYRELARQLHPDKQQSSGSPAQTDAAAGMKERVKRGAAPTAASQQHASLTSDSVATSSPSPPPSSSSSPSSPPPPPLASSEEERRRRFEEVQQAYAVLSDPDKRAQYDAWRRSGIRLPFARWMELGGGSMVRPTKTQLCL